MTRAGPPQHSWLCNGEQLKCVSQARYLGTLFRSGHSFQPTFSHLERRMWASQYFLRKRYWGPGCSDSIWLPLQLHPACVEPAGSFGSELWGVYLQHARGRQRQRGSGFGVLARACYSAIKTAAWNCAHKRPDDTFLAKKLTPGILARHAVRHNTEIGIKDTAAESEAPPPNH